MKNYLLIQSCILVFIFCIRPISEAQIIAPETLAPTDVWNQTFNNAKAVKVYMIGTIKNDGGKVLVELKSESFYLKQGINQLSNTFIKTSKTDWHDQDAKQAVVATGNFPKGNYTLCTRLIEHANDRELANPCRNATVGDLIKRQGDKSKYKNISAYGSASVDFMYNDPKPVFTELPNSYVRIEAEQGLSVYSFPIAGQFRYTTEKTNYKRDVDMFTLAFDRSRFERNVKELILRKVIEAQLKKVKLNEEDLRTLTEYEDLESKVKSAALQKVDQEIQRISSELKSLAQEKVTDATSKQKAALQKKYNQLLEQKRKFDQLKNRYIQLKSTYDKWITSGRLEELKKMAYDPPQFDDPKQMLSLLKQYGAYTGMNKFLFNIKELSIGTAFPVYSPLTLNGTQIFGANFEWNPGIFYIAASGGKVQSAVSQSVDSSFAKFEQKMAGLRLGIGRIYSNFVSMNIVRFWDIDSSISTGAYQELYPEQSWVGSTDFQLSFGKNRIVEFGGELAGNYNNGNRYDTLSYPSQNLKSPELDRISKEESLKPNLSSSFDFAYNANFALNLFNQTTHARVEHSFVGPGFSHPGVFGLPNDLNKSNFRLEQDLFQNKLALGTFYQLDYDNFSAAKSYRTDKKEIGIDAKWHSKKLSSLNLRFSNAKISNSFYFFNSNIIQLGLAKNFKIAKHSFATTTMQTMYYFTKTDSVDQEINSLYVYLNQSIGLPISFSINFGGQFSNNSVANLSSKRTGLLLSLDKTLFKKIRLSIGSNYDFIDSQNKLGFTIGINGSLAKNLTLNCRAYSNQYSEYPQHIGNYSEKLVQLGVKYNW